MTVDFLIIHLIPGDPAAVMAGPNATAEDIAQLRSRLHLDLPLHVQFVRWVGGALRGDMGESLSGLHLPWTHHAPESPWAQR